MAMILEFPEMQVSARRRPIRRGKPSAEIILFPGVRYERWSDELDEHATRSPAVIRDRLQLVE
jgi:hypothetical protein